MGINLSFEADAKIERHQCQSFDTNINILKMLFFSNFCSVNFTVSS